MSDLMRRLLAVDQMSAPPDEHYRQPEKLQVQHVMKSWTKFFQDIVDGNKTHDIRAMDRNFAVGDTVALREYDFEEQTYTGRGLIVCITYITSDASPCAFSPHVLNKKFCVLSITRVSPLLLIAS